MEKGALSVRVVVSHGLFVDDAIERLKNSPIDEVILLNSIEHPRHISASKMLTYVSIAKSLADAIRAQHYVPKVRYKRDDSTSKKRVVEYADA
jgi:ribose-phosphate pyrophosphokinase